MAQVSVNAAALGQLSGVAPPPAVAAPVKPRIVHPHPAVARKKPVAAAVLPVVTPRPPVVKPAPPKAAVVVPVPAAKPPAPVVLAFAPGSAALPAGATAALQPFCTTGFQIRIGAHAPADPTAPSVPMRLSLTRAFAVRDVLVACGLPLAQILPLALGSSEGSNDLTRITSGPTK
ncbi:MAG: hypothetical protein B7Z81_02950 [Acidocella sp. 20-61-6]|nr:MAG: hypothetical protein B7Z81_02950 [Acidocella sp. 20-61-6]